MKEPLVEPKDFRYDPDTGQLWRVVMDSDVLVSGKPNSSGYLRVGYKYQRLYIHRLVWFLHYGKWPVDLLDHVDRDKSNNRISNLREASKSQNAMNSVPRNSITGYRGVYLNNRGGRFGAVLTVEGEGVFLGSFDSAEEASAARDAKAKEVFGDFAFLNGDT